MNNWQVFLLFSMIFLAPHLEMKFALKMSGASTVAAVIFFIVSLVTGVAR